MYEKKYVKGDLWHGHLNDVLLWCHVALLRVPSLLLTSPIISIAQHLILFIAFNALIATSYILGKLNVVYVIASEITFMTYIRTIYPNHSISHFVAFGLAVINDGG